MLAPLTPREKEIVQLIVNEFSSTQIAARFELSVRTVETHRKNIYRKTHTQNLIGLMKYAIREGYLQEYTYYAPQVPRQIRALQNVG